MGAPSHAFWPTGHGCWFFSELSEFEASATRFLAEGVHRNERVWFVAEDPGMGRWPEALVKDGVLILASIDEAYGPFRDGDLAAQRSLFVDAAKEARADGYSGLRVAADNSELVIEDLTRWMAWEAEIDEVVAAQSLTALCAFDRSRLDLDTIHQLLQVHPEIVGD